MAGKGKPLQIQKIKEPRMGLRERNEALRDELHTSGKGAYIKYLEQQNAELSAKIDQRPIVKRGTDMGLLQHVYEKGVDDASNLHQELGTRLERVMAALELIQAISACDNGKRTRTVADRASSELMARVDSLDNWTRQHPISDGHKHWQVIAGYAHALHKAMKKWIGSGTDANQSELRAFIANTNPEYDQMRQEVEGFKKRGRAQDEVNQLLGELAYKHPFQERRMWAVGEKIYQDLRSIPDSVKTSLQAQLLTLLRDYMDTTDSRVDPNKRRELGKKVSEEWRKAQGRTVTTLTNYEN